MKAFRLLGAAIAVAWTLGTAEAALIDGDITWASTLAPSANLSLLTAIDFKPQTAFVTFVTPGSALDTTIDAGQLGTWQDFSFFPFAANNPLWSLNGFTFDLASLVVSSQNAVSLILLGTGTLAGNGFTDTPYDWSFSADRTVTGTTVAWSATNATTPIPEPTSLLLLGTGLLLAGWRLRKGAH